VSIFDTYRVVYTSPSGWETASFLMTREAALTEFNATLAVADDWTRAERVRVISEKVWIESQAVKR
jgi:hypothetical protein